MTFTTQAVEDTRMVPIAVHGRQWMCRAQREQRFAKIYASLVDCIQRGLIGDIAEIGCWIGLTSDELTRYLDDTKSHRFLHCFESFRGLDRLGEHDKDEGEWIALPDMREQFHAQMRGRTRWQLHEGDIAQFRGFDWPLCWAYVDVDIYEPTLDAITILERCLVPGGVAVFDDYGADKWWPGVRKAVDERMSGPGWELEKFPEEHMWLCFARRL